MRDGPSRSCGIGNELGYRADGAGARSHAEEVNAVLIQTEERAWLRQLWIVDLRKVRESLPINSP